MYGAAHVYMMCVQPVQKQIENYHFNYLAPASGRGGATEDAEDQRKLNVLDQTQFQHRVSNLLKITIMIGSEIDL